MTTRSNKMKFATFVLIVCVGAMTSMGDGATVDLPRIVGGVEAADGIAPHQCSMQISSEPHCGCAILSDKYVLTAAHCLNLDDTPLENISILVGTNDLEKGGERYPIEKYAMHENFDAYYISADIGLIRVKESIKFSSKVKSIAYSKDPVKPNSTVQLYGWGLLDYDNVPPTETTKLQSINLTSIDDKKCAEILFNNHMKELPVGAMCTLNKIGEGTCYGDSGSGLVFEEKLVGIVSYGKACARGLPDVFTEVAFYDDWIQENMED